MAEKECAFCEVANDRTHSIPFEVTKNDQAVFFLDHSPLLPG